MKKIIIFCLISVFAFNMSNSIFCTGDDDSEIRIPEYVIEAPYSDDYTGSYDESETVDADSADSTDALDDADLDDDDLSDSDKKGLKSLIKKIKRKFPSIKNVKSLIKKLAAIGIVVGGATLSVYAIVKAVKKIKKTVGDIASGASKTAFLAALFVLLFKKD